MWVGGSQDLGQSLGGSLGGPLPGHSILQTGQQRPGSFTFTSPCRDSNISISLSPRGGSWGAAGGQQGGLGLYLGAGERGAAVCAGSPALHAAAPRALLLPLAAGLGRRKRVSTARWGGPWAPPGSPRHPQVPAGGRGPAHLVDLPPVQALAERGGHAAAAAVAVAAGLAGAAGGWGHAAAGGGLTGDVRAALIADGGHPGALHPGVLPALTLRAGWGWCRTRHRHWPRTGCALGHVATRVAQPVANEPSGVLGHCHRCCSPLWGGHPTGDSSAPSLAAPPVSPGLGETSWSNVPINGPTVVPRPQPPPWDIWGHSPQSGRLQGARRRGGPRHSAPS